MGQIGALLSQLGVDQSFFFMFGVFAATYFIVSALMTRPMGSLLIERDKRTTGRQEEIAKIRSELTSISTQLQDERRKAQQEASQKFSEIRSQALLEQRKIVGEAREEFSSRVKAARERVSAEAASERQKLERAANELRDDVVAKLLGISTSKSVSLGREA